MIGTYDFQLVALSLAVATLASYTALDLARRVSDSSGRNSRLWLLGGAFSMGTGIWSMHFIGMLAFRLPIPLAYDFGTNLLSWVIAMVVSGIALFVARRPAMSARDLVLGAVLMGIGISTMHYTGMAAMQMSPPIEYDAQLFIASVLIAMGASLAALALAFNLRRRLSGWAVLARLGSAVLMGLAITGMHYTGMAAAHFAPDSICLAGESIRGWDNGTLAVFVGLATLSVLAITLVISALDAHFAAHSAKLAQSLHDANEQLRKIALYDTLTGLPNRVLLADRLDQVIRRATRESRLFAVLFVDLDRFKPVNDNHGHGVGDQLLQLIARRLERCIRASDTVSRAGGDEFIVVLSEIAAVKDAALIGRKILDDLATPASVQGLKLEISCSIGISVFPADGKDAETLLVNADAAMYSAKREGKNNFRFFEPLPQDPVPGTA